MALLLLQGCEPGVEIRSSSVRNKVTTTIRLGQLMYREMIITETSKCQKTVGKGTTGDSDDECLDDVARDNFSNTFAQVHHRPNPREAGWYMLGDHGQLTRITDKQHIGALEFGLSSGYKGIAVEKKPLDVCNPAYDGPTSYGVFSTEDREADELIGFYSKGAHMFQPASETRIHTRMFQQLDKISPGIVAEINTSFKHVVRHMDTMVFNLRSVKNVCFRGDTNNVMCYVNDAKSDPSQSCKKWGASKCKSCNGLKDRKSNARAYEYVFVDADGHATPHIAYWTTCYIKKGDEILVDYGKEYWNNRIPHEVFNEHKDILISALHKMAWTLTQSERKLWHRITRWIW